MSGEFVLAIVVLSALAIGLAATFSRKLEEWYDQFCAWRESRQTVRPVRRFEGSRKPPAAPRPAPAHMSSQMATPPRPIGAVPGTGTNSPVPPVPAPNDLTYDEAVRRAAAIKVGGKWWLSGKKLYSVVGGNHARFLEIVSEVRGAATPDDVPAAPPGARSRT